MSYSASSRERHHHSRHLDDSDYDRSSRSAGEDRRRQRDRDSDYARGKDGDSRRDDRKLRFDDRPTVRGASRDDREFRSSAGSRAISGASSSSSAPVYRTPAGRPPLPQGWLPQFDSRNGRWFYFNQATGRSQWEAPGFEQPAARAVFAQPRSIGYDPRKEKKKHRTRNTLLGAAGGLVAASLIGKIFDRDGEASFEPGDEDLRYRRDSSDSSSDSAADFSSSSSDDDYDDRRRYDDYDDDYSD